MEAQWWWWFYQLLVKRITAHCEVVGPGLTSHFLKRFQQLKQSEDDWALCAVHTIATIAAQSLNPVRHICLYMSCQCYQPIFVILCKYKGIWSCTFYDRGIELHKVWSNCTLMGQKNQRSSKRWSQYELSTLNIVHCTAADDKRSRWQGDLVGSTDSDSKDKKEKEEDFWKEN